MAPADDWHPLAQRITQLARRLLEIRSSTAEIEAAEEEQPRREGVLLQARRPYTNFRHIRQLIAVLSGEVYWVDRHIELAVLDIVASASTSGRHISITLIREGRPEERIVREAGRLRQELADKEIDFDLICVPANLWDAHDRWIVSPEGVWTLPPAGALTKVGELTPSSDPDGVRSVVKVLLKKGDSVFGK